MLLQCCPGSCLTISRSIAQVKSAEVRTTGAPLAAQTPSSLNGGNKGRHQQEPPKSTSHAPTTTGRAWQVTGVNTHAAVARKRPGEGLPEPSQPSPLPHKESAGKRSQPRSNAVTSAAVSSPMAPPPPTSAARGAGAARDPGGASILSQLIPALAPAAAEPQAHHDTEASLEDPEQVGGGSSRASTLEAALLSVGVLRHLVYRCGASAAAVTRCGALGCCGALWGPASAAALEGDQRLTHEILLLVDNLVSADLSSADGVAETPAAGARQQPPSSTGHGGAGGGGSRSFLEELVALVRPGGGADVSTLQLCCAAIGHAVERSPASRASVLRSSLPSGALRALSEALRRREGQRAAAVLRLLAHVAAHRDGALALLALPAVNALSAPSAAQSQVLDVSLDAMAGRSLAATQWALFLLRNIAVTAPESTAHFTGSPRALPMLVAAMEAGGSHPAAAACAASALSALCFHEQRAKAALRRIEALPRRISNAKAQLETASAGAAAFAEPGLEALAILEEALELDSKGTGAS